MTKKKKKKKENGTGLNWVIRKHGTGYQLQHEAQSQDVAGLSTTVKSPNHQILLALQS